MSLRSVAFALGFTCYSAVARAEDSVPSPRHYLLAGVAVGSVRMYEPDYGERAAGALWLRALYLFRPIVHFDLGGGLTYLSINDVGQSFAPHLSLRPYFTLGSAPAMELGINLHGGFMLSSYYDVAWSGPALALGPDLRVSINRTLGVQVATEVYALGSDPKGSNVDVTRYHLPGFGVAVWVALVVTPP